MKASLFIASNREEVARDAPWAKIIEPLPELKDGWLACDTIEAYDHAFANRANFLPTDSLKSTRREQAALLAMTEPNEPNVEEQTQEAIEFNNELAQWLQRRLTPENAGPIAFVLLHIALSLLSLEFGPDNAVPLVQKSIKRWRAAMAGAESR